MTNLIKKIRVDLKKVISAQACATYQRFFKEKVKFYGIKSAAVNQVARKYWPEMVKMGKAQTFKLFEQLLKSDYCEEASMVTYLLPRLAGQFQPTDLKVFKRWISFYINNWAKCDGFCNHTMGTFLVKYPEYIKELKTWTKSKNRWLRRAAAVSLIVPARKGKFLKEVIEIAQLELTDADDLVQKGYGWLLKEASRQHQKDIFNFVMKNKNKMPRTALRYAIELMPKNLKAKAMAK